MLSLMRFFCTYRSFNEIKAKREVENWMQRSPKSYLPHVAHAIVWNRLGDSKKAKVSLDLAQSLGANDQLYYQILVKVCGELHDTDCLRQATDPARNLSPLYAYYAQALATNNKQAIMNGLRESPNYLPLLKLQQ